MFLVWGRMLIFTVMVLVRNRNHEEDNNMTSNDPFIEREEELEGSVDQDSEDDENSSRTNTSTQFVEVCNITSGRERGSNNYIFMQLWM
jgi:hypothetical protein